MLGRLLAWATAHKVIAAVIATMVVIVGVGSAAGSGQPAGTAANGSTTTASPAIGSVPAVPSSVPFSSSATPPESAESASPGQSFTAADKPSAAVTASTAPASTGTVPTVATGTTAPPETAAGGPSAAQGGSATGSAVALLAALEVKGRAPMTGYSRDQFGQAWADTDRNGCDTRNDILRRDLTNAVIKAGTSGCLVLSGDLADPYTGTSIHMVRAAGDPVQIDHVVALGDAWQTGAQYWPGTKRLALANDPLNLLAVDGSANEQKGDADAASWLPANKGFRCAYVARQVAVKAKYQLWVTQAERDALARILTGCPGQSAPSGGNPTLAPFGIPATSSSIKAPASSTSKPAPATTAMPAPSSSKPASGLPCAASMSNAHPAQYSTTDVVVHTAAGASVSTAAHYKSTVTSHSGTASSSGVATIAYSISRATIGYPVTVDVTVSSGGQTASCTTSFTPVAK